LLPFVDSERGQQQVIAAAVNSIDHHGA